MNQELPAEGGVLLLCARTSRGAEVGATLRARLGADLDWGGLVRLAREHGVIPLVFRSLDEARSDAVPDATLDELREAYFAVAACNLLAERELLEIASLLEGRGIPVISFKGPVLATAAYGSGALRQYVDLDVLVQGHDVGRALSLLRQRGYRPVLDLRGFARSAYLQSECAIDLIGADGSVLVELHWDLMPRYFSLPFDLDRVWREHGWARLGQHEVRALSVPDLLLFLCVHGAKHRWEQLRWICDVAELIRSQPDLDWCAAMERAAAMGSERMLLLGLLLAAELLDATVPPALLQRARSDAAISKLAGCVRGRLFDARGDRFGERNLFYLRAMESPWQRLRYCLYVALVPTKHELGERALPASLSFLHYPLHVAGIVGQALEQLGGLVPRPRRVAPTRESRPRHAHH